jgi:uncharacterized protein (DUF58 family)
MQKHGNGISPDIVSKIKQLEIFTRRLLNGSLVGDSRSAIKGTGFEFDQIREYSFGDDIRFIDWKASARNNKLLVKQYIEERSRTIFLAVDVSQSSIFGSGLHNKHSRIVELASVLALVAQHGKDHVGLLLFSDKVEAYIPPGSSLHHVHHIMERMLTFKPRQSTTDISQALKHFLSVKKSDAILFLISDFIDEALDTYLAQAARRYDLIAVRCLDANETAVPPVGFITVEDLETGELVELDLRNTRNNGVKKFLAARIDSQNKLFRRYGIDLVDVSPERTDYLADMIKFFRRRMMY